MHSASVRHACVQLQIELNQPGHSDYHYLRAEYIDILYYNYSAGKRSCVGRKGSLTFNV